MNDLPRLSLHTLESQKDLFIKCMETRGFVILTDLGEGEQLFEEMMSLFVSFCSLPEDERKKCTSKRIYKNERGVPMWYCGFEGSDMRDAFRVCTGSMDIGCWPSPEFENTWKKLTYFLRDICDRCLSLVLDRAISPPTDPADDKTVSYAVCYPNNRGGQQAEGINIKEHVDPSLFVIEPITKVPGLELLDPASPDAGSSLIHPAPTGCYDCAAAAAPHTGVAGWVGVEGLCRAGKEAVIFGGKALETASGGRIRAARHRVIQDRDGATRHVFIVEQKYADFFPPPVFDD